MFASLGDKQRMLPYLKTDSLNSSILDVGGGDGSLLVSIKELYPHVEILNLDAAPISVERSRAKGIPTMLGYSDEIHKKFSHLQNIIASSVVHEIFSYGNLNGEPGRVQSVKNFLQSAYDSLTPGGRLIIRDGVSPDPDITAHSEMRMTKNHAEVDKFLHASPFTKDGLDRKIQIRKKKEGLYTGSLSSLMEFAFTYTWGKESFEREVNEFYGVFTLEELSNLGEETGFTVIYAEKYVQQGYIENLPEITFSPFFPDTNALWVFEK